MRSEGDAHDATSWQVRYEAVRAETLARAAPLSAEDQCIQSMPDASPTKWHLAHTTWFFETLLLRPHAAGYRTFDPQFHFLFNSYYEALGPRHPRPQRGMLTRPSLDTIHAYRRHVDQAVDALLRSTDSSTLDAIVPILELGLHHEQQHQELLITDILHALSCNPLLPAYLPAPTTLAPTGATTTGWFVHAGGIAEVGHEGSAFAFDNERPRHAVLLQPFAIADRPVTCGEFAAFIADGGYRRPELWLSDGWAAVQAGSWQHPAYWLAADDPRLAAHDRSTDPWHVFGLHGVQPMAPDAPVSQLSLYEAAAFAEWAGARLPTEFEWEAAAASASMRQMSGHVWQWTRSSYDPYPGFRPLSGAAAEYNGKFMVGQLVLRGGSVATPTGHVRTSYRNFFPPAARWQFSGLRLAKDL
ncbi:MAG: ergothioneine biosynthesis protein EgtB [Burkholderiales bacterium]|nr:ergothioneine biosynthesis protein EgtB [Burkholderiales bacterium]